jgi:hypothetical protein
LIQSQSMRLFSSGRNPVLIRMVTTSDSKVGPRSQPGPTAAGLCCS